MEFVEVNKKELRSQSEYKNGLYEFVLGDEIEILTSESQHKNTALLDTLFLRKTSDIFTKYVPVNKIYFTEAFFESDSDYVSIEAFGDTPIVRIDAANTFSDLGSGYLIFSGYLALTGQVLENRPIFYNEKVEKRIYNDIKIFALGARGADLFGLMYVPSVKGIQIGVEGYDTYALSTRNHKLLDVSENKSCTIENWFTDLDYLTVEE